MLDTIVVIGGDDTLASANFLNTMGFDAVVGVPKTIDNDVHGTDSTYGHWSAVDIAQRHVEKMFTEADDMKRVALVEIMGRKAGWLAARGGGGGGANIELIPEVEVPIQKLVERVQMLFERQKHVVIAVAEGYRIDGSVNTRGESRDSYGNEELGGVAYRLAGKMKEILSVKTQVQTPGYDVRNGKPNGFDRMLARALGAVAAEAVHRNLFGVMAAWKNGKVIPVPLELAKGGRFVAKERYDTELLQTRLLHDGDRQDIEAVFL
jgi:6-phosphofructokinase 1